MKKVLIIGSQGYLGSRLTDYLLEKGYKCSGIDIGFFQYGVLYNPSYIPFKYKNALSITSEDLEGNDVVVQLAGISNDPLSELDPKKVYDPTREYAIKIAKICKEIGIRYIFPSSCSVYGINDEILNEEGSTRPQTPYSLNKLQIEQDLSDLADSNFSPISLRFATIFGISPRIRFDVVINMLCGMAISQKKVVLNSNGLSWRPHLYIDDACEAIRCCIEWDYREGNLLILNVGRNDNNWRILDIAKFIQNQISGCTMEFLKVNELNDFIADRKVNDGVDKRTYQVNFDKIHRILPYFQTKVKIEDGILNLLSDLNYYKLDISKFKQREFYRLQQLEYLFLTKQFSTSEYFK